ncbi:hypothetical protein GUITHDRAFT_119331 [Guillardia theta CCMP2712]|uniref:Uncharacterized protein n=1 Tax=Guillardia theta (strain CCMP2712) TaxID=905079 RepID=L1IF64_GUITC|nr:hypothetical protein GUITHDRAFT_119331 [Guillardia theta CCMP2712]EKX34495.1 hypothetical protein GUITHDRAFT_119331 [Guillardia theta CCMP2712]|eukprot:XP_005821475.1 hypothetical protein GUITHDRAFT_119331 [Guillardia theta CCMP2712]
MAPMGTQAAGEIGWTYKLMTKLIEMGLVINAVRGTDCRPRSTGCIFQLNWKCANLDDSENKPIEQQAAVQVNSDGTGMLAVVPHFKSFDGVMNVVEATYRISGNKFEGTQVWNWTSNDGEMYCNGADQFVGTPGKSTCDETWDANMDA